MNVKLIDYPKDALALVATGARVCYSSDNIFSLNDKLSIDREACRKMIDKIFETGHMSCFEHINFTFAIGDISRIMSHQFVRHRIMSPHERSQRYVNLNRIKDEEFYAVIPEEIKDNPFAMDIYIKAIMRAKEDYNDLLELGIKEEDARYVLPGGTKTALIATFNGRSLIHFFNLRCCNRSQTEIREVAIEMLRQVREVCPEIFNRVGPSCFLKKSCPEGKMCCGKMQAVLSRFDHLGKI